MRRFRKWVLTLGIVGVTPGLAMAGPMSFLDFGSKKPAATKQVSKGENQDVAEQIAAALRDAKLSGYDIQIQFRDGTATLTGSVPSLDQKTAASRTVAKVRRVRRVENQLVVAPSEQIAQAGQTAPEASSSEPRPLEGIRNFGSLFQKSEAEAKRPTAADAEKKEAARADSESKPVSKPAPRGNQQIAEQLASALRNASLTSSGIDIEVHDGQATLTGTIGSEAQKQAVTQLASSIQGITGVENRLEVLPQRERPTQVTQFPTFTAPSQAVRQPGPASESAASAQATQQAFAASPSVQADPQAVAEQIAMAMHRTNLRGNDITIRYQDGKAILLGSVASPEQVQQAAEIAMSIPGVQSVDARLAVWGGPSLGPGSPFGGMSPELTARGERGIPVPAPVVPAGFPRTAPVIAQGPMSVPPVQVAMASEAAPAPPVPPSYGHPGSGAAHAVYNMPHLPQSAWPSYAAYPNYAQVAYPKEYSASAWPYIGPFYPYPQIPLGWRKTQLEWDDGYWSLNFRPRTGQWWWFLNPENW